MVPPAQKLSVLYPSFASSSLKLCLGLIYTCPEVIFLTYLLVLMLCDVFIYHIQVCILAFKMHILIYLNCVLYLDPLYAYQRKFINVATGRIIRVAYFPTVPLHSDPEKYKELPYRGWCQVMHHRGHALQ